MRRLRLSLVMALLNLAILVGCESKSAVAPMDASASPPDDSSSAETEPLGSPNSPAPATRTPSQSSSNTSTTVQSGKLVWQRDTARDATIPDSIPVYQNSTPVSGQSSGERFVFEWESTDSKQEIMDYFRDELPKRGFTITKEKSYGVLDASKSDQRLTVWIGSPEDKPRSILVRLEAP